MPEPIRELLADESVVKVGKDIANDAEYLRTNNGGVEVRGWLDVAYFGLDKHPEKTGFGLKNLARMMLGVRCRI